MLKQAPHVCLLVSLIVEPAAMYGQKVLPLCSQDNSAQLTDRERLLLERINKLERRLSAVETRSANAPGMSNVAPGAPPSAPAQPGASRQTTSSPAAARAPSSTSSPLALSNGTTINFNIDGYYGYNFEHPTGRVNLLRANDPLSDSFSLNQAVVMVERAPDVSAGWRLGYRLDLMFGQQTEILQGSTANEARPQAYRNIFQVYGSYVLPLGSGLQVDFGKFASALGVEGSYTKDQLNYSRSYFYYFLPFYHEGIRATYNLSNKVSLQYWLVNGANQTEDFNGFKSQAALLTVKPTKNMSWNVNYYEGQEQRDVVPLYNPGIPNIPTQPGLSFIPVSDRHDGRFHVLDSYASFNLSSKWSTTLEGDYVINRIARNSAPAHVYGGVGYLHRQLTKTVALNWRFGYLADRGGLFSGVTQDLKDVTMTGVYQPIDGFQTRLEYRRDFSNRPFFLTNNAPSLSSSQTTLTVGMLWWFGGKQGNW